VDKHERLMHGDANAFVDPDGYNHYLSESEKDFRQKVDRQRQQGAAASP
jgi:hypothetical protein